MSISFVILLITTCSSLIVSTCTFFFLVFIHPNYSTVIVYDNMWTVARWTINGNGVFWLETSTHCSNNLDCCRLRLEPSPAKSSNVIRISRNVDTTDYESISVQWDMDISGLTDADDICQMQYSCNGGSNFFNMFYLDSTSATDYLFNQTESLDGCAANNPNLVIRFKLEGGSFWANGTSDNCWIDEVYVFGTAVVAPPSVFPSVSPSVFPSLYPTSSSPTTNAPTIYPTSTPSTPITKSPTNIPTANPTRLPAEYPTGDPTQFPSSFIPTLVPTYVPTYIPSVNPTSTPTPTVVPSSPPTSHTTFSQSENPTIHRMPTLLLMSSSSPIAITTLYPSIHPTLNPSPTLHRMQPSDNDNEIQNGNQSQNQKSPKINDTYLAIVVALIVIMLCVLIAVIAVIRRCSNDQLLSDTHATKALAVVGEEDPKASQPGTGMPGMTGMTGMLPLSKVAEQLTMPDFYQDTHTHTPQRERQMNQSKKRYKQNKQQVFGDHLELMSTLTHIHNTGKDDNSQPSPNPTQINSNAMYVASDSLSSNLNLENNNNERNISNTITPFNNESSASDDGIRGNRGANPANMYNVNHVQNGNNTNKSNDIDIAFTVFGIFPQIQRSTNLEDEGISQRQQRQETTRQNITHIGDV